MELEIKFKATEANIEAPEKTANIGNELLKSDVSTSTILTRNQHSPAHKIQLVIMDTIVYSNQFMSAATAAAAVSVYGFLFALLNVSQFTIVQIQSICFKEEILQCCKSTEEESERERKCTNMHINLCVSCKTKNYPSPACALP